MVLIANIRINMSQINLDIHKYNLDLDTELLAAPDSTLNSPSDTPSLSIRVYATFIDVATKTKTTSEAAAKE